ncbi:OpgC family protein [Paenochrobactrum sp. BZR 588]|uniref:OpgC family protein n=1 Tax=unclassified Paenochrobactrum TaxID=2639760 RepID=UPI003853DD1B
MTNTITGKRDSRIDVFRALALLTIFINHVPGTVYENFTHKNLGFSDATEAFVLISGMAVALAYGNKFISGNRLLLSIKMWRRAGVLYVSHMMTTMVTIAIFAGAAILFSRPEFLNQINIGPLMEKPAEAMTGLVILGHQLGYNNILSMYGVLLLMTPVLLILARISLPLLLAVSGAVWLAAGVYHIAPPNFPNDGVWFLNPFSWQFLFSIGIAGTIHVRNGGEIPLRGWMIVLAAAYLVLALVWVRWPLWGVDVSYGLPAVLTGFDKTFLSLPRLLHILSIVYLLAAIPALANLARTAHDHPLAIMGRHSLPIFIAGTLLAMVAQVMKLVNPGGFWDDTLLIAAGIVAQFAFAYYLEWLSSLKHKAKTNAAPAMAQPVKVKPELNAEPNPKPAFGTV